VECEFADKNYHVMHGAGSSSKAAASCHCHAKLAAGLLSMQMPGEALLLVMK
jgi:hypothetical protein